jgi:hypothetical protein
MTSPCSLQGQSLNLNQDCCLWRAVWLLGHNEDLAGTGGGWWQGQVRGFEVA